MTRKIEQKSAQAQALRAAGFVPLPRLWVTPDQLDAVMRMAEGNRDVVNDIRGKARQVAECVAEVRLGRADRDLVQMGFAFGCIAEARRRVKEEQG